MMFGGYFLSLRYFDEFAMNKRILSCNFSLVGESLMEIIKGAGMKQTIQGIIVGLMCVGCASVGYTADNTSQQIQLLNSQIQAQLEKVQQQQQKQIQTMNAQTQAQIKQVQATLEAQIQKMNNDTNEQVKKLKTALEEQIKQVQQSIPMPK